MYGAIQQLQLSVAPPGRYSVVHLLLTLLWFLLGALALVHANAVDFDPATSWFDPAALVKLDNGVRFLMWFCLIQVIAVYTRARETLLPLTLAGVWLVLLCFSLQTPVYFYVPHLGAPAHAPVGAATNGGWYGIHLLMLANVAYALYLCHRYYRRGHRTTARILSASLIAILATTVYEMLAGLFAPPLPLIDLLGFLGFLLVVGFYLLPHYHRVHRHVAARQARARAAAPDRAQSEAAPRAKTTTGAQIVPVTPETLKAIGWYADMGIRRLARGAAGPDKLAALFRKIRDEAASRLPPGSLEQ